MKLDTQQIEILGRNFLTSLFVAEDIEIAIPIRDKGLDLIAFKSISAQGRFRAIPVQMKAFSGRGFSVHRKYEKFPDLLMAYVWNVQNPLKTEAVVMTFKEAVGVAEILGWTQTTSWERAGYSVTNAGKRVLNELLPYRYEPGKLKKLMEILD